MTWSRALRAAGLLALGLACGGMPSADPTSEPPVAAPAEPAAPPSFHPPGRQELAIPARDAPPSDEVARYLADCRYIFPSDQTEGDHPEDECKFVQFDQNCAEDFSGCCDKGQQCKASCGKPCTACESTCADHCESCKQSCKGDTGCERLCAESRLGCGTNCIAAKQTCTDETCNQAAVACNDAWEKELAQKCPDCGAITECLIAGANDCAQKFRADALECFKWCGPGE